MKNTSRQVPVVNAIVLLAMAGLIIAAIRVARGLASSKNRISRIKV